MAGGRFSGGNKARSRKPGAGQGSLFTDEEVRNPVIAAESGVFDPPPLNPNQEGLDGDLDDDPYGHRIGTQAPMTEVPTKTTNEARPRTTAAGYDQATHTLTVIFRDGTPWNYYEVTPLEAANFHRANSKGRFIRLYLDAKPYGPPTEGGFRTEAPKMRNYT